jgi:preprotein translocase subunit SecE
MVECFLNREFNCKNQTLKLKSKKMNKIANYFRESFKELTEKVTWPTWPQLQQSTMIVLGATLVITFIVLAMDFVAGNGLKMVYKILFPKSPVS